MTPDRPRIIWTSLIAAALTLAHIQAALETLACRGNFNWQQHAPSLLQALALSAFIASKSLLFFLPALALAWVLLRQRKVGAAWAAGAGLMTLIALPLYADLVTYSTMGLHLHHYLQFITGDAPWEWAGGLFGLALAVLGQGAAVIAVCLAVLFGLRAAARRLSGSERFAPWVRSDLRPALILAALSAAPLLLAPAICPAELIEVVVREQAFSAPALPLRAEAEPRRGLRVAIDQALAGKSAAVARALEHRPCEDGPSEVAAQAPRRVVIVILESLRADALDPRWMPGLAKWSRQARVFTRHHSNSNATHTGLYALLYGRAPIAYQATLDADVPPQLTAAARRLGYRPALYSSSTFAWVSMDRYIAESNFDELVLDAEGGWPARDRRSLERLAARLEDPEPGLALAFLMSSHFPYAYPESQKTRGPLPDSFLFTYKPLTHDDQDYAELRRRWLNKYRACLAFLDGLLAAFLEGLDLRRDLVIITGDHGESLFDDGRWLHTSRLSDAQTRVPLIIAGPGIPRGEDGRISSHVDLLPTILHAITGRQPTLRFAHGRSLLAPNPDAEALLTDIYGGEWLWVTPEGRLQCSLDGDRLRPFGFVDPRGNRDLEHPAYRSDPAPWARRVAAAIDRLAR